MLCHIMSQLTARGAWLSAVLAVFAWNKLVAALAEQLFSGVICVAQVPVHFIVTVFGRKEKQSKAIGIWQPQIFYLLFSTGFSHVFRVILILTMVCRSKITTKLCKIIY